MVVKVSAPPRKYIRKALNEIDLYELSLEKVGSENLDVKVVSKVEEIDS